MSAGTTAVRLCSPRPLLTSCLLAPRASDFNSPADADYVPLTEEQSRRVLRKIDRVILPLLMWVYVSTSTF